MTFGLMLTAVTLGLRHGVDWDHIAAIADLSSNSGSRRRGLLWSLLYALGHAAVVFCLGTVAILIGTTIPSSVDTWMSRIVGVTLIALGAWILSELVRKGRQFRLRSRWMLIINGTFAGLRRVRRSNSNRSISVDHSHEHDATPGIDSLGAHDHPHREDRHVHIPDQVSVAGQGSPSHPDSSGTGRSVRHTHAHRHDLLLPDRATARYGNGTATGIGVLHGIGVESPTQIALFVASTSVAGSGVGILLLLGWVGGLILANTALAILAGFGLLHAERNFAVYATLASIVAVLSIVMGVMFTLGLDALPEINL